MGVDIFTGNRWGVEQPDEQNSTFVPQLPDLFSRERNILNTITFFIIDYNKNCYSPHAAHIQPGIMLSKSLLSATITPLVLSLLKERPQYGFQLLFRARKLYNGQVPWSNSKLYPILHRMEHDKWIESYWQSSDSGPDRKYYRITPAGLQKLAATQREWRLVNSVWSELWGAETAMID